MRVLLVEDEAGLAENVRDYLSGNEFMCDHASDIESAQDFLSRFDYDCILLDLNLPDGNGMKLLEGLKAEGREDGVIILSARDGVDVKIEGLRIGADDYLVKPFHLPELLARIHALLRRKNFKGQNRERFRELELDTQARKLFVNGIEISLTRKEFDLLLFLFANRNKVLSKNAIAEHLSGEMAEMMGNLDFIYAHIKNLKRKLTVAGTGDYIQTIYGLGYQWRAE